MHGDQSVTDADMPQIFQAADRASLAGQKQYMAATRWRLTLVLLAAAAGIYSWRVGEGDINVLALVSLVCFVAALLIENRLWRDRPDKAWYDGRAVAESVKTLAWKFAVCAQPFPSSMPTGDAVDSFSGRVDDIRRQFRGLDLAPINAPMISEWMTFQRSRSLRDRHNVYLKYRIHDQKDWYKGKSSYNRRRSAQWRVILFSLESLGVIGALIEALTRSGVIIVPTIAAAVGAVLAWTETKQHDFHARAYAAALSDLAKVESRLEVANSEDVWAAEVNDAEDAISREHTLWLASRSQV